MKNKTYCLAQNPFFSFQGEGKYTGYPAVFVRWRGCNLSCDLGGKTEPQNISSLEEFRAPERGCDSGYAWQKEYSHLAVYLTLEDLQKAIEDVIPFGVSKSQCLLIFTGGEPMLFQKEIVELIEAERGEWKKFCFETNGTIEIKSDLHELIIDLEEHDEESIHFAISPKLASVTNQSNGIIYDALKSIIINAEDFILKYVMDDEDKSWDELNSIVNKLRSIILDVDDYTWIMPLGSTKDQQASEQTRKIVLRALDLGYKISMRAHVWIFGGEISR